MISAYPFIISDIRFTSRKPLLPPAPPCLPALGRGSSGAGRSARVNNSGKPRRRPRQARSEGRPRGARRALSEGMQAAGHSRQEAPRQQNAESRAFALQEALPPMVSASAGTRVSERLALWNARLLISRSREPSVKVTFYKF